jgi:hypothetical protein
MAQRQVNPYIFVARIAGILGLSLSLAIGILALLGALWVVAVVALALGIPFALLLYYTERGYSAGHTNDAS